MSSGKTSSDNINGDSNIEINESHSLLFKLFFNLLTNSAVQTGLRQLTRLSKPLLGNFDDNIVKITSNVSRWVSHENIYNQFANAWLAHNYPFNGTVMTFESLAKEFEHLLKNGKRHEYEFALKNFYNFACEIWKSLSDPHNDEIKNALLAIVAKVVNKTYHFQEEALSTALYNVLRMLVEKRRELVSKESFFNLVKVALGDEYYQSNQTIVRTACNEFYVFAKRFILIDFPLATNNKDVLKLILNFVQDNGYYYGDYALNIIEKKLDLLLRLCGERLPENAEDKALAEKARRILNKAITLGLVPVRKIEDLYHQAQKTHLYIIADQYLHITDRVDDLLALSAWGYKFAIEKVLEPGYQKAIVLKDKIKDQVIIILQNLDIQLLKKRYHRLHAQYEVLQKCVMIVADEGVKLIFDKQALAELGENGKKKLHRLYAELKDLETQKIRDISLEYYAKILKKAQATYNHARKAVYYQKREIGDQEAASAIRPPRDEELDKYDSKSHPHNIAGRDAVETVALESH